jgi:hypothetical protein
MALRDRGPESDFRGYFSDTETKLDEGNTEISRHFERGPLWYALETDWLVEAGGFEPLHLRIEFAKTLRSGREHSNVPGEAHLRRNGANAPIIGPGAGFSPGSAVWTHRVARLVGGPHHQYVRI